MKPQSKNEVSQADVDINDQIVNVQNNKETLYEVGKILRKQYTSGKWFYRVKWLNFDSKNNSWVKYKDLNAEYQSYVAKMNQKISTDRRSKKKN